MNLTNNPGDPIPSPKDARRDCEEQYAFLLRLSDSLRPLADAVEIQRVAATLIGEHLGVANANYARIENEQGVEYYVIQNSYAAPGRHHVDGRYRLADFPGLTDILHTGRTMVVPEVATDPWLRPEDKASCAAVDVANFLITPLLKGGRLVALFAVHGPRPRAWTDTEVALLKETAERTWAAVERARAEAALRESEAKYRTLFETMGQGYSECELIRDADGRATDLRYLELNPAFERLSGLRVAETLGRTVREAVPGIEEWKFALFDRIVRSGVPERLEYETASLGRWFEVYVYPGKGDRFVTLYENITDRKRAEAVLRASEERQAFLLRLTDALRPLRDCVAVQEAAMRVLGEHLRVHRAFYGELLDDGDTLVIGPGYNNELSPLVGQVKFSEFHSDLLDTYRTGRTVVIDDLDVDVQLSVKAREAFGAIRVRAAVGVPLVKDGRVRGIVSLHQSVPRKWTAPEIALFEETVERTWASVERAKAEAARRASDERLRLALSAARMGTWTWNVAADAHHRDANLNALFGLPAEETVRPLADFLSLLHPDDRKRVHFAFHRSVRLGRPFTDEFRVVRPDGSVRWLRDQGDVFGTAGRLRMTGACVDVTDLKDAEAALRRANDELENRVVERTAELEREMDRRRDLARWLGTAQEDERQRVARDLHDSLGQLLAGLSLALKAVENAAALPAPSSSRLAEAHRITEALGKEIHALAVRVRPTSLDDIGLSAALEQLVNEWTDRTGVEANLHASGVESHRLPLEVETTVYRVVQEALTNVTKHARASRVGVIVSRRDGFVSVVVEDDGVGFDPSAVTDRLGLMGMRERVDLVGGKLEIESKPGTGTSAIARIPLPE